MSQVVAKTDTPNRSDFLDGLRGLAILLTVFHHIFIFRTFEFPMWAKLERICGGFFVGVDIFFALSGYFITTNIIRDASIKRFYIKRFFRIVPNYYVWIVLSFLFAALFDAGAWQWIQDLGAKKWHYFLFLNNYTITPSVPGISTLQVSWSLCIEEHFYFVWPSMFLILCLQKKNLRLWLLSGFTLALLAVKIITYPDYGQASYTMTHFRFDGLLAGCFAALWVRELKEFFGKIPNLAREGLSWFFLAFIVGGSFLFSQQSSTFLSAMLHFPYGICTALLIVNERETGFFSRVFKQKWLTWMGRISYSVYLYHFFFLVVLRWASYQVYGSQGGKFGFLGFLVYLAGSFLLGFLAHRFIEETSMAMRRKALKKFPVQPSSW